MLDPENVNEKAVWERNAVRNDPFVRLVMEIKIPDTTTTMYEKCTIRNMTQNGKSFCQGIRYSLGKKSCKKFLCVVLVGLI